MSDQRMTRSKTQTQNTGAAGQAAQAAAAGEDEDRPLSENAAALLEVCSLPALEQLLLQGGGAAAARDVAALGTVLGRPGNPGVQQFLQRCWEELESEAAPSWMASLPRTLDGYDVDELEFNKLPDLKALCRALSLPQTGKKEDFVVGGLQAALLEARLCCQQAALSQLLTAPSCSSGPPGEAAGPGPPASAARAPGGGHPRPAKPGQDRARAGGAGRARRAGRRQRGHQEAVWVHGQEALPPHQRRPAGARLQLAPTAFLLRNS